MAYHYKEGKVHNPIIYGCWPHQIQLRLLFWADKKEVQTIEGWHHEWYCPSRFWVLSRVQCASARPQHDNRGTRSPHLWLGFPVSITSFQNHPQHLTIPCLSCWRIKPKGCILKEYSTEAEVSHAILETTTVVDPTVLPSEIVGKGLNLERQWYLYEKIRILCHSNLGRDITCPKPSQAKPKGSNKDAPSASTKSSESSSDIPESMPTSSAALQVPEPSRPGTKRRLCSVCANPGHNKKTCPERK